MQSSSPLLARPGADLGVRLLPLWDGWQAGRPSEEIDAARSLLNIRLRSTKAPPELVRPEHVNLLSGRSHAKSLWSLDVRENEQAERRSGSGVMVGWSRGH